MGCRLAVTDSYPFDLLCRQAAFFCSPLRCFVFQLQIPPFDNAVGVLFIEHFLIDILSSHKAILAVGKIADEVFVPQALSEQNVSDRYRQCTVRAGFEW